MRGRATPTPDTTPGFMFSPGLGSRGFIAAPLAKPKFSLRTSPASRWPLERDLMTALHPGRFLVRDLKRRERLKKRA